MALQHARLSPSAKVHLDRSGSHMLRRDTDFHREQGRAGMILNAAGVEPSSVVESENYNDVDKGNGFIASRVKPVVNILYKFSRPHTIKGTILASTVSVLRVLRENPDAFHNSFPALLPRALLGLIALLCGNAYIVGINQIYDVKIDTVNKPFLPIAAKRLSIANAWKLVIACLLTGLSIVKTQFSPLIGKLYLFGVLLGTLYSVPPFQFKRYPFMAGGTIALVRGFLLNFGVYYAISEALNLPFEWKPVVVFIASFMTLFATVIAITKDLPDIEGDRKYNIDTFAAKYGVMNIAKIVTVALSSAYIGAICLPFLPISSLKGKFNPIPMCGGHFLALVYFLKNYEELRDSEVATSSLHNSISEENNVDNNAHNGVEKLSQKHIPITAIKKYYRKIWDLFYAEYLLYLIM